MPLSSTPPLTTTSATKTTLVVSATTLTTHPFLTKDLIYQMGILDRFTDVRVTRVDRDMSRLIYRAIKRALPVLRDIGDQVSRVD